jgi:ferric-dicitrate binding protein FerR (iron transport regulator)
MKQPIDYIVLKKFIKGTYTFNDFILVNRWFEDKEYENDLKKVIGQHWEDFETNMNEETHDLSIILYQIKQKIVEEKKHHRFGTRIINFYSKVAAVLLIPLILYSLYSVFYPKNIPLKSAWIEINSPKGARTQFELPDGTIGWLNSDTRLKYSTDFENIRQVTLSGEAWFQVKHNPERPFTVKTSMLDVEVLGTIFNVSALPNEGVTDVVLQEGIVQVRGNEAVFSTTLSPNEKLTYNTISRTCNIQSVNAQQYSAWKDGMLMFRNEPLSEVFKRVGRWYNVEINIENPELAKYRYRATFNEEQLDEVLRLIALTLPIDYVFENRVIGADGTFNQRKISVRSKTRLK